jgi:hypothetical protein
MRDIKINRRRIKVVLCRHILLLLQDVMTANVLSTESECADAHDEAGADHNDDALGQLHWRQSPFSIGYRENGWAALLHILTRIRLFLRV